MLSVLALSACTGTTDDSAAAADPYLAEEGALPSPNLDTDALAALLTEAVALARSLHGEPVLAAYDETMMGAEYGCPSIWTYNGDPYWSDDCFATDGTHFDGYAFHTFYVNQAQEDGSLQTGETFSGVVEITTPEGAIFTGGGDAWSLETTGATGTTWSSGTTGGFAWDAATDGWMATSVVPELTMTLTRATDGSTEVAIDGGYTGAEGVDAVVFDALTLYTASTCATEPAGVLSVRDTDGGWYDVIFDGAAAVETAVDPDACDGCGAAWFGGDALGQVCVDFTPLIDWEDSPWD